jgi:hypothetical protein
MKRSLILNYLITGMIIVSCNEQPKERPAVKEDIVADKNDPGDIEVSYPLPVIPGNIDPDSIVAFSRTLIGTPYLYASTDPSKGFDCSGFITYVFNHFNMKVPRSSVDFTNYGTDITEGQVRPGDLILFTGTDSTIRIVGHMGIVESIRNDTLHFIHSTSGKGKGVVITPLEKYYRSRFVKLIRIFPDSLFFQ